MAELRLEIRYLRERNDWCLRGDHHFRAAARRAERVLRDTGKQPPELPGETVY